MDINLQVYWKQFEFYKLLADKSIDQVSEEQLFIVSNETSNSIAIIMKHMAGNMLSRWTNIFEEDGEKEWRNRENEFVATFKDKESLLMYWESGWQRLFETLSTLKDTDLEKIIYIRNMGCTVHDGIIRQLCHYSYHVGQIVFAAKALIDQDFVSLSIPKGTSESYNASRFEQEKSIKHFTDDQ